METPLDATLEHSKSWNQSTDRYKTNKTSTAQTNTGININITCKNTNIFTYETYTVKTSQIL